MAHLQSTIEKLISSQQSKASKRAKTTPGFMIFSYRTFDKSHCNDSVNHIQNVSHASLRTYRDFNQALSQHLPPQPWQIEFKTGFNINTWLHRIIRRFNAIIQAHHALSALTIWFKLESIQPTISSDTLTRNCCSRRITF